MLTNKRKSIKFGKTLQNRTRNFRGSVCMCRVKLRRKSSLDFNSGMESGEQKEISGELTTDTSVMFFFILVHLVYNQL